MNGKLILAIRAALMILAVFLTYKIYREVMEPIEFEKIQEERYAASIQRLEYIRDAQKVYKSVHGSYTPSLESLIAFVDTGMVNIEERKDSSFLKYNKTYQKDMLVDTVVRRVIGQETVKSNLSWPSDFDAKANMLYVPYTNHTVEIWMDASQIMKNRQQFPVFQAAIDDKDLFGDFIEKGEYSHFIEEGHQLILGSLTEVSLSGNWK